MRRIWYFVSQWDTPGFFKVYRFDGGELHFNGHTVTPPVIPIPVCYSPRKRGVRQ